MASQLELELDTHCLPARGSNRKHLFASRSAPRIKREGDRFENRRLSRAVRPDDSGDA
jgi:hypothetical protein